MRVELRKGHWIVFATLAAIQVFGIWISVLRSPYGPAVRNFFVHGGWFGLVVPLAWILGAAFAATVLMAEFIKVFTNHPKRGKKRRV